MGDGAGDLDRWRPLHLLTSARATCASWRSSSRSRASAATPAAAAELRRGRRVGRGAARVRGRPRRRDRRPPRRARRVARRAGRADDPRLRPLRRAAARRRGRLGDAAVRAERARRPHLRARRDRRQGAGAGAAEGRRGVPRGARRAAAERPLPLRGRGGDRQPEPRRLPARRIATSSRPTSSSRPTARCGARSSRRSRSRRRGCSRSTSSSRGPRTDLHSGRHGGAVQNPTARARRRSSPACTTPDGAVAVAGFYDDVVPLSRRRPRRARARAVRRGGLPRRGRRAGPARRARLHDARAALDPADARGERSRAAAHLHSRSSVEPTGSPCSAGTPTSAR